MNKFIMNMVGIGCIAAGVLGLFAFGTETLTTSQLPHYEYTIEAGTDLRRIELEGDRGDIQVNWMFDGGNTIEINGQAPDKVISNLSEAKVSNGTLVLDYRTREPERWINFGINTQSQKHEITIHATETQVLERLKANVAMGTFTISGGRVDELEANSNLGGVIVKQLQGKRVKLSSDAGSVLAEDVDAVIDASSSLGQVKLLRTTQSVTAKADAGSIVIDQKEPHPITASSNLGSIKISVSPQFDGVYDLRTNLGDIDAPDSKMKSDMVIRARADLGEITIVEK
ncbi:DUF4097 domain-containing protein [Paenibacillus thiaminolyticus]|uniref:DUF4097 domain-containing protein n=1 Tax=Paenibacillus thiaminolyticus TaxID=49283 RepID=A0AAP9DVY6_PANTH|nr:DUF4097 family beta strand repeat-containing protein [Paenibacillus thiaminolyticus]MCY9537925.1 DUF4097 domain-containing protein [Paenibacillus thiaminolyticus]MCY9605335.1 DUF4097 domain-containing protein [Paenibacillus thiaminolyticus]MCY9606844.1 DUF4097 domain-containing protein [Paenibacillus thiaminolyticus]MCY9612647.1 DUF4097 domain-containing protein [Paenibacillus thiaminolyticus]MCY9620133.1 DUF4097 domain-containing protein [Paenibacillus thiaminolyticus]